MSEIHVITGHAQGEITEKKSRFLADVFEVHSEEQALSILESVRKKYYDARHHCFAFVIGKNGEMQRFSDDREPQGTAGRPILEVIRTHNYRNTLIVVTRYFGGVLLGTGGLTRAYSSSAAAGLKAAEEAGCSSAVFSGIPVRISCDYSTSGKIQYLISQLKVPVTDTVYDTRVTFGVVLREEESDSFLQKITEVSNASAEITRNTPGIFLLSGNEPVPYTF